MERLKSIFVSLYVAFVVLGVIYTLFQIYERINIEVGFCNLIILCTAFFYFGLIYVNHVPRTSKNMAALTLSSLIGLLGNLYFNFQSLHLPSLTIGVLGFIGWLLYTYWSTDFGQRDHSKIQVGKKLPDASFTMLDGQTVSFSDYMDRPAILLFYRGNWCPFCTAQIKELVKEYKSIEEKGAYLIFISPQSQKHTQKLANKFDIPAIFLMDEDLRSAKQLGLFDAYGTPIGMEILGYDSDNVYPTLVVTDKNGIIRYADLTDNYRVRPEPSQYLEILETA